MYDPTGVITADIREGLDLDSELFTGVSDASNVKVVRSLKNASRSLNINNLLFAEQQQANLETIDPESATGER